MRLARALIALAFLAVGSTAWGQGAILQGGATTPGHVPMYVGQGTSQPVVQDSGSAGGGGPGLGLSELLQVNRTTGTGPMGSHSCFLDNPTTTPGGYHYFCLDANAQGGGLITYGAGGAASALPLAFNVNGVAYPFPFSIGGILGPGTSVANDAACWNNVTGTLLKDCGAFVTVGGTNTWTGTNNFTGPVQVLGAAQTFPGSGNLVGISDTQTLTNKSINASEVNSGSFGAAVMPAFTGNVASSAGSTVTTIQPAVVTNAMMAVATQNTTKGAAASTAIADLVMPSCSGATNALQWLTNTGYQCGTLGATTAGWGINLSAGVFSVSTAQPPYGFDMPVNLGLTAGATGSNLTINVVGANGSAPSASNPVSVPFRSATLATGTPVWASITSALSVVVPSGATLGTANSVPFRLWIFMELNGGTPELGVAVCSTTSQIFPCAAWEQTGKTTITITGLAASSGVLYSTTGVASDSVRIIGYCDYSSGLATAGSWASACTTLQTFGPGIKKPGDVVQSIYLPNSTITTATGSSFVTTSLTQAIVPTAAMNLIKVQASGTGESSDNAGKFQAELRRGASTAIGNLAEVATSTGGNALGSVTLQALDAPGVATSTTYAVYIAESNNTTNGIWNPGSIQSVLMIDEIMGALPEPANDNGLPEQRMVG